MEKGYLYLLLKRYRLIRLKENTINFILARFISVHLSVGRVNR